MEDEGGGDPFLAGISSYPRTLNLNINVLEPDEELRRYIWKVQGHRTNDRMNPC